MRSRTWSWVPVALVSVLALAGCGDDGGGAAEDERDPCPTFAVVSEDAAADEAYKDYVVGFELSLMRDPDARADILADISDRLCLAVTEERRLSLDAVVVDSGRLLGPDGQQALVKALTSADGVTYAEPDAVISVDEPPATAE